MAENFFNVFREVWIEDRGFAGFFFVCLSQRNAFGDAAALRLGGMKDRHGPRAISECIAPARTRAISAAKSLAASASEMWITSLAMKRLYTVSRYGQCVSLTFLYDARRGKAPTASSGRQSILYARA